MERHFEVPRPDGPMPCFAAWPDTADHGPGPYPVVLMYMDAPGIRDELYGFARRIAGQGYYAVLPDLYYRLGLLRFRLDQRTEPVREDRKSGGEGRGGKVVWSEGVRGNFK